MASEEQESWQDVSESSSFSEEDETDQPSILEELELGHVRRIDQENEPSNANLNHSAATGESSSKILRLVGSSDVYDAKRSANVLAPVLPVPLRYEDSLFSYFLRPDSFGKKPLRKLNGPSPFDVVSDEVIVKIFSFLPRSSLGKCAPVCKRFQRIVLDESFWKAIKMYKKNVPAGVIGNILTRGCRYLSLAQATLQHPASFLKIKDSQLTYLDMSFCVIKENEKMILDDILEPCRNLRKLSLEKVQDLTLNICTRIVQNAATITILNIGNCLGLCNSHGGVEAIITHCQNLEELNISWTDMKRDSLEFVCNNLTPKVQKLNISGYRDSFSSSSLLNLVQRCNQLVELNISDSSSLNQAAISILVDNLQDSLVTLSLSRCTRIHPAELLDLNAMPKLHFLNVFGMLNDNHLLILRKNLPRLSINENPLCTIGRPSQNGRRGDRDGNNLWDVKLW